MVEPIIDAQQNKESAIRDQGKSMGLEGEELEKFLQGELRKEDLGIPRIGKTPCHEPITPENLVRDPQEGLYIRPTKRKSGKP